MGSQDRPHSDITCDLQCLSRGKIADHSNTRDNNLEIFSDNLHVSHLKSKYSKILWRYTFHPQNSIPQHLTSWKFDYLLPASSLASIYYHFFYFYPPLSLPSLNVLNLIPNQKFPQGAQVNLSLLQQNSRWPQSMSERIPSSAGTAKSG